ncbi:MAG TPA: M13-type metalloendopeptidase [Candidatus Acidoferrum sp.]|nr:M13-type metalloendopeptidase [Candidatus Acidoferrum sp.]
MLRRTLLGCAIALALTACSKAPEPAAAPAEAKPAAPVLGSGIEQKNFDPAVAAGDDFYRHINGVWLRDTPIPAEKSTYGSFTKLDDEAQANLRTLIEKAGAENAAAGTDSQKVGDFFKSFMDEAKLEELGAKPLQETLQKIAAVKSKAELMELAADLDRLGVDMPAGFTIDQDNKQSDHYITYLTQSGLELPDRDWYLVKDDTHTKALTAYATYITKVLSLAGYPRAIAAATSIQKIEHRVAEVQWDKVKNRDPIATYNKKSLDEMKTLAPAIDWPKLLQGLGITETTVIVAQPSFFQAFGKIWNEVSLQDWQDYFAFKTLDAYANYLSDAFVRARFDFRGRVLGGQQELKPRWKRGVDVVESSLGEVVGKLYVANYFKEESKQRMDQLVENLRAAYKVGIDQLDWMTPATKTAAQEKLAKFNTKIGYPKKWKDYSKLTVDASDLVGNVMRSRRVEHEREVTKLGKPIDRDEWLMTPQTINAYYNPSMNEVVFPAAILQPPFFNVEANDAVNYGAIGAVIGHEFSHGFDDQGSQFDGDGNLRNWWTDADAKAFKERTSKLSAQYSKFESPPNSGKFLSGDFTLGENIGDLSGLAVAYRAYKLSLNGKEDAVIDGFTGDQRFFMGWAQVWRTLYRPENLEVRRTSDPHSPGEARCNYVLRNFDPWYAAFGVKEGDKMYLPPEERVKIW